MLQPRSAALVALLLALVAAPAVGPASAAPTVGTRRAPTDDFEGATRAEQAAVEAVLSARTRREKLEADARELDGQVAAARSKAQATAADVSRVEIAKRNVEVRLVRSQREFAEAQTRTRDAAAVLYRRSSSSVPVAIANLNAGSVREAASRSHYMGVVGDRLTEELDAERVARADVRDALRSLRIRRASAARAAAAAERDSSAVTAVREQQHQTLEQARAIEAQENAALASARSRRVEFERAAAAAAAASAAVADSLKSRPSGGGSGQLRFPADGPITSRFGSRVHPIFQTVRLHAGIDIGAGYGAPVRSAAAGTVVTAGTISGYGNAVVVDHGGGLATLYGHLSRIGVRTGAQVGAGQTIGAVGNTGNSTGPHLHFEVRVQGTPVDPMSYL